MTDTKTDAPTLQDKLRNGVFRSPMTLQAADALDESDAVIAALVEALKSIAEDTEDYSPLTGRSIPTATSKQARAAIAKADARKRG